MSGGGTFNTMDLNKYVWNGIELSRWYYKLFIPTIDQIETVGSELY